MFLPVDEDNQDGGIFRLKPAGEENLAEDSVGPVPDQKGRRDKAQNKKKPNKDLKRLRAEKDMLNSEENLAQNYVHGQEGDEVQNKKDDGLQQQVPGQDKNQSIWP